MDPLGTLVGSSSESRFTFKVQDTRLRRGDYVKVPHEDGIMLAQVSALKREKDGLLAEGQVIGRRDKGMLTSPKTPFRPNDPVDRADERLIAETLGLGDGKGGGDEGDGAYLGLLRGLNIRVSLDIDLLVQKHVSVMAKTGAGKSYVVGVLIEELLKRQVPVVIVDPHGEYTSLSQPNNSASETQGMRRFGVKPRAYADRIMEYSPDDKINADAQPLRIEGTNLGTRELGELLGGRVNAMQLGLLHQAVKDVATRRKKGYTLQDIIAEVNRSETNAKWTLLGALQYLEGLGLFAEQGTPVSALVKRGQVTVINLRGCAPEVQEIVVTWLCKGLFEARKVNTVPPLMLVVEEAHHFCPERGFTQAMSSDILRTIASEGRKFGLGLCVVSQRPAKVDKNVLSQANTQVMLKVTNPNDLKAIIASVEGLTKDAEDQIQKLSVGTALVSHPRIALPVEVDIRPRETRHGGKSVSVLEKWGDEAGGDEEGEPPAEPERQLDAGEAPELEPPPEPEPPAMVHVPEPPLREAGPPMEPGPASAVALVPAVQDLRQLFQGVLREPLDDVPDANLAEVQRIVEGKERTLRGLRLEFPAAPELEELERMHRAALARVRHVQDTRRRQRGLLGRFRRGP